jgi:hypothetical protein
MRLRPGRAATYCARAHLPAFVPQLVALRFGKAMFQ